MTITMHAQALDIQYSCSQMVPEVELGMILRVVCYDMSDTDVGLSYTCVLYAVMCITAPNFLCGSYT